MTVFILSRKLWAGNKSLNAGLKGTGKTFLAKAISKLFKVIVYTPHEKERLEWRKLGATVFKPDNYTLDFPIFCFRLKHWAEAGKFNMAIIDEADMLFKSHFDVCAPLKDMIVNHRHWGKPPGLALIFCTKRPQNLPTQVYGEFENLCLFSVESPQAAELLNRYWRSPPDEYGNTIGLGDMVRNLDYGSHQFVLKRIGKPPVVMKLEL